MAGTQIGLSDLHYAILTTDEVGSITYQAPVVIPGVINANINPNPSSGTLYADDGPAETYSNMGEISLELELKDLPLEVQAALLGHTITGGVLVRKSTDTAPYVAIGFKSMKTNGKYRFVWLHKGKFQLPEMGHQTKDDKVNFQTPKIKAIFLRRDYDNAWIKQTDEDHPDYTADIGTNWFTAVEGAAPAALTCTPNPADEAAGVAVDANITWTFNNAIQVSDVTVANFVLVKNDGTAVAGALSVDSVHKVVTLNPTANLDATSTYVAIATKGVRDIYGQTIAANSVTNFVTV